MKAIRYLPAAQRALLTHRNMAERIRSKVRDYAENPAALANVVTELRGGIGKRLRVGDFRVIFEETEAEIIVTKIGPRGRIYEE